MEMHLPEEGINLKSITREFERGLILQALQRTPNRSAAALLLGINRTTLVEKMRSLGMQLNKPNRKEAQNAS